MPNPPAHKCAPYKHQRFVLDAYIFTQLLNPKVSERMLPNCLDVWASLGSSEAEAILEEAGETEYPNNSLQMLKLQSRLAVTPDTTWTESVYAAWLHTLTAVTTPKALEYPQFMRTTAWARKDLHSALGSWAELKHDTILYAKQVETSGCAGPGEPVVLQHWVEPVPEVYARLAALAQITSDGMEQRGLLSTTCADLLKSLVNELALLQGFAEKELAGELLNQDESDKLKYFGRWLDEIRNSAQDAPDPENSEADLLEDEPAAIVANVASNPFGGKVLEVGTGLVFEIIVATPDGNGGLQAARGGTYSHHEFAWPIGNRLTDEEWRAMVHGGSQPAQPAWTASFVAE